MRSASLERCWTRSELPMTLQGHVVDVRASVGIAVFPEHGGEGATLASSRRYRDVRGQARELRRRRVGSGGGSAQQRSSLAAERPAQGGRQRRADARLSAQGRVARRRRRALRRGAGAMAASDARAGRSDGVHPICRADRLHPRDHAMGAGARDRAVRGVALRWLADERVDQSVDTRLDGPTLPDRFAALLQRHRCAAQWIALEITESAILDDPAHAIKNLERLHALGCKLAIDDYGTGYSSLAYLRRLPVHELKIDKSFVIGMAADASDALIVRSTIDLAHNLGLSVVAEGVEDDATLDRLRAMGCDMVQGYLLSRPMGVAETAVWMRGSVWTKPASEPPSLRRVV